MTTPPVPPGAGPGRLSGPFWRFWTAAAAANVADGIRLGSFPLIAITLTADPFSVALVVAAQNGAWLAFGLFAGVVVDRLAPRGVLLLADLVRVLVLGALLVGLLAGLVSIPVLVAVSFVLGVAETLRDTAAQSVVPALVPGDLLERANGRLVGASVVGNEFLGPLLGAVLFTVAAPLPVASEAALLAVALALVLSLPRSVGRAGAASQAGPRRRIASDLRTGLSWLRRDRRMRTITLSGALLSFADSVWWSILVVYVTVALALPSFAFGVLLGGGALGGIAGALVAERVARGRVPVTVLATASLLVAVPPLVLTTNPPLWAVVGLLVVSSAGFAVWNVIALSVRQRQTPRSLLGRVTSAHRVALYGSSMVGALCGGALASGFGLSVPFVVGSAVALLAAAVHLTDRHPAATPGGDVPDGDSR